MQAGRLLSYKEKQMNQEGKTEEITLHDQEKQIIKLLITQFRSDYPHSSDVRDSAEVYFCALTVLTGRLGWSKEETNKFIEAICRGIDE